MLGIIGIILVIIIIFLVACNKKVTLTCEDAEKIVLEKIKAGTIIECELKRKNFEIEVLYQGIEYEFIIDGNTGEIKKYDGEIMN